jgi:hypothetical protein
MPFASDIGEGERQYRRWCRINGLFLSPMNDLADLSGLDDLRDDLELPSITTQVSVGPEPPVVYGMYNQAKQEYTAARYIVYEALTESTQPLHLADRGTVLVDMLDYRLYRLWVEKLKMAFMSAYAILDKLAYLMNEYWEFGLQSHEVSFSGIWYVGGRRFKGISGKTKALDNGPLQGLFWLSRDFYDRSDVPEIVVPDARMLHEIRNHIAHKYLRVHDSFVGYLGTDRQEQPRDFSYQVTGDELAASTLKLLRLVRSAMTYLAAAMVHEEASKATLRGSDGLIASMVMFHIDDEHRL